MFEIGISEAQAIFPEIIRKVERGEECVITRHGKPVIALSAIAKKKKDTAKALRAFMDYAKAHPIHATLEEMIAWKNEGRR